MKINICYLVLNMLLLLIGKNYLEKKKTSFKKEMIVLGAYLIFTLLTYSYINGILNNIFKLSFLDTKAYLILLIITNVIMLYTINNKIKLIYKIPNYLLFILLMIILGANLSIVLGNKYSTFYIMDIGNAINLMDLSFVIFILYLIVIAMIYLSFQIVEKNKKEIIKRIKKIKNDLFKIALSRKKNKFLTKEELLNYDKSKGLYINGKECSIILEDSNKDNIIKNYETLNKDINAKLTNGYTLEENKLLKSICMKLNVGTLRNVDINNGTLLNRINIEEYNLLKKIFGIK